MFAIVGIPGSVHHAWKHGTDRAALKAWAEQTHRATLERNPALGSLPVEFVNDREALRRRWRDGRRIYSTDPADNYPVSVE